MRFVDADALKEQIESHVVSMSVCLSVDEHYGKVTMREDCLQDIEDAPTVDAIPVEWLKGLMLSTEDDVDKAEFAWILREWESEQKEQEAQDG